MITQQNALAWINNGWRADPHAKNISAAGGVGIDVDGLYGFQCKDFVNAFALALGAPFPAGNAVVLQQGAPAGWQYVTSPQPGDVALRDYISGGTNYGDAVLVLSISGNNLVVIGQNQVNVSLTVGHIPSTATHTIATYKKFLRRNYDVAASPVAAPAPAPANSQHPLAQYVGKTAHLSASVSQWHVYPVGSIAPRTAVAVLDPAKYGGLAYTIEAVDTALDSVIITTQMFGRVSLPIADNSAGQLYSTCTIS